MDEIKKKELQVEERLKLAEKFKQEAITKIESYQEGYNFAQKEIKDKYNHYNSKLKEATKTKLDRRDRTEYIIKLEAKVEILKEMMKYVGKQ